MTGNQLGLALPQDTAKGSKLRLKQETMGEEFQFKRAKTKEQNRFGHENKKNARICCSKLEHEKYLRIMKTATHSRVRIILLRLHSTTVEIRKNNEVIACKIQGL